MFKNTSKYLHNQLGSIHFLDEGMGRRNSGRVINFLPAQKGRVSINLTQQRVGHLNFTAFQGRVTFFNKKHKGRAGRFYIHAHRDSCGPPPLLKNECSLNVIHPQLIHYISFYFHQNITIMVMVSNTLGLGLGFSLTVLQRRNGPSVKKKKTGHLIHNNKVQLIPLASFRALHVPGKVSEI